MGIEARPNLGLWEVVRLGAGSESSFPLGLVVIIGREAVGGLELPS